MTRHIPGLHQESRNGGDDLEGVFLVRVDRAFYVGTPPDLSTSSGSPSSNPKSTKATP